MRRKYNLYKITAGMSIFIVAFSLLAYQVYAGDVGLKITRPNPGIGSWWVIRKDNKEDIKIELTEKKDGKFIVKYGEKTGVRYTDEWNQIDFLGAVVGRWITYRPHICSFRFDLIEVGKKWTCSFTCEHCPDEIRSGWGKVLGQEKVSVPAGVFDAIKVELIMSGRISGTYHNWYAPDAQFPVKRVWNGQAAYVYELVRYELHNDSKTQ